MTHRHHRHQGEAATRATGSSPAPPCSRGRMILVTLAAVAVFLIVQSIPALVASHEDASILTDELLVVRRPARLRHHLGRRARAPHGRADLDRHRPLHLALRAPAPRLRCSATSSTCSRPCRRSCSASGASACSPPRCSPSTPGSPRTSAGSRSSPARSRAPAARSSPPASCSPSWCCRSSPRSAARSSCRPRSSTRRPRSRSAPPAGR